MAEKLTEIAIKAAKPKEKPFKLADGRGMFLLVNPNGSRWWRLKYRFGGKEKLLSLGTYPDTKLAKARERRDEARNLLKCNKDPATVRRTEKLTAHSQSQNSFEIVA